MRIGLLEAEVLPMEPTIIGLDFAKMEFQLHGVDERGNIVFTKRLHRGGVLTFFASLAAWVIGMEACARGHRRAREISKLGYRAT
ncbi:hypothetical protein [Azospirillum sp. TSO5]|nr:hypothetical protein [Azospirillum sp. TSO5]